MNTIEKKNLSFAKFKAEKAASNARNLLDSKFVENYLSEKELKALERCTEFLMELEKRFSKMYYETEAWKE